MQKKCSLPLYLMLSLALIVVDQLTKLAIESNFAEREFRPVTSFFNLGLVYNPGAAFSFLANHDGWQRWFFTALSTIAAIFILYFMRKHRDQPRFCLGLSFVLAGAIGNLIDRIRIGKVVDFLDFHYLSHHWPAFNIADSVILIGVVLLLIDEFTKKANHAQR